MNSTDERTYLNINMENRSQETLSELANRLADIENAENGQDDQMYRAINQFIGTREQSYQQFLNGFTQLTGEDVLKYNENRSTDDNAKDILTPNMSTQSHNAQQTRKEHECEDDLEVELLEEGCRNTSSTDSVNPSKRALVKFDNFVEDEPIDDLEFPDDPDLNDLLVDSGYVASFNDNHNTTRGTTLPDSEVDDQPRDAPVSCEKKGFDTETNFGEVDVSMDTSINHSIENQTCLEMKTTDLGHPADITPQETITDEVKEFYLDPSFDYDNVRLTPKFSTEDMIIIKASNDLSH